MQGRAAREALRVLYVGWTRARDRLILAAEPGKLLEGLLGTLRGIDESLISEPAAPPLPATGPQVVEVTWAGRPTSVEVRGCVGNPPVSTQPQPGVVRVGRVAPPLYAPARLIPSAAEAGLFTVDEAPTLGAPIVWRARVDVNFLGRAVHDFLAADVKTLTPAQRQALATGLIQRYGVGDVLSAATWVAARWPAEVMALLAAVSLC